MKPIMTKQLLQQLHKYQGKWVALFGSNQKTMIVAVGKDAVQASERAVKRGYKETTLLKVLPLEVAYVPLA